MNFTTLLSQNSSKSSIKIMISAKLLHLLGKNTFSHPFIFNLSQSFYHQVLLCDLILRVSFNRSIWPNYTYCYDNYVWFYRFCFIIVFVFSVIIWKVGVSYLVITFRGLLKNNYPLINTWFKKEKERNCRLSRKKC